MSSIVLRQSARVIDAPSLPVRAPSHVVTSTRTSRRQQSRSIHRSTRRTSPAPSPRVEAIPTSQTMPSGAHSTLTSPNTTTSHKALRMIMFGKPGAGKGTLSTRLVSKYDVEMISTGDLLRAQVRAQTALGKQAEAIMASGGILDDKIVLQLVQDKLGELNALGIRNWILDGFPRTLGQGRLLDPLLEKLSTPLNLVINLDVPDEVILSRIADRWTHLPSGRIYNLGYNKPKVDGKDDVTGEPLSKRPDDKPEVAAKRLQQFYRSTSPLLQYYSAHGMTVHSSVLASPNSFAKPVSPSPGGNQLIVTTLTGKTSDEIWPGIEEIVERYFNPEGRDQAVARREALGREANRHVSQTANDSVAV